MMESMWGLGLWAWALPVVIVGPGIGFALRWRAHARESVLGVLIDAAWIGMAITWINVAVVRELRMAAENHSAALVGLAVLWMVAGWLWSRHADRPRSLALSERLGAGAVLLAVVCLSLWRSADIARPLHGHWYLEGADAWHHEALPISAEGAQKHGWSDAGAFSVVPQDGTLLLTASAPASGRLTLAVQGPLGSRIAVGGEEAIVAASVTSREEEGSVRRYLREGVAGLTIDVDLQAGESVSVEADGDQVFVMPGADAVWSLHAAGVLRYVHYYQLLNQVENQVWAQEMLQDRWATLNQPPGWSPLLTLATVMLVDDMQSAAWLFLWVLVLVGLTAVRLGTVVAPTAHPLAMLVPAAMVLSHGLLMFEPGSYNFPDSLYAAAVLAVALAIAERRVAWMAAMGVAAGLLRWPGVLLSTMFILVYWRACGASPRFALRRLWQLVAIGAVLAVIGMFAGKLNDLLFILYFETFPEHWHGEYSLRRLLPRVPGFYALWVAYTGGGVLMALAACWGPPNPPRRALCWLLASIGAYSLMLATIDHHPTHYFLPLVAISGVAVICASDAIRTATLRWLVPVMTLIGVWIFLWFGDVGLQPIEDMVVWLEALLA
jgi:hypothetical protein